MDKSFKLEKACEKVIGINGVKRLLSENTPLQEVSEMIKTLVRNGLLKDAKQNEMALREYYADLEFGLEFGLEISPQEAYEETAKDWMQLKEGAIVRLLDATLMSGVLPVEKHQAMARLLKIKQTHIFNNQVHLHHFDAALGLGDDMQTEFMFFFWMYGCCVEMHDAKKDEAEKFYKYVYENVHNTSTSDERENFLKESAAIGLGEIAFATRDFSNALKYAEEVQNNTQHAELKNRALVLLCLIYEAMKDNSASQEYYSMIVELGDEDILRRTDEFLTKMNPGYRLKELLEEYKNIDSYPKIRQVSMARKIAELAEQTGDEEVAKKFRSIHTSLFKSFLTS